MKKLLVLLLLVSVVIILPVLFWQFTDQTVDQTVVTPETETSGVENDAVLHTDTTGPSLEEKVGQLFLIGHWSYIPTSVTSDRVDDLHLGGVIVMDAAQDSRIIRGWSDVLQNVSYPTPLLIGIDQEGGAVSRLKEDVYIQTSQPDIITTEEAYDVASDRAEALRPLGINGNFAPVLDKSTNPDSFMYERVFRNPASIPSLADAMIRGYQNNGIIAIPKHYPGHPDTADDSHITLPILELTESEYIKHTEAFTAVLQAGNVEYLMTAHVQVPVLDSEYPATLSPAVLTDLRERIGYQGVVISDDLAMQAISDRWSYEEAAVLALSAGVDMIMLAAEPEFASSTISAVITAVENGELSEDRIDEAYARIMKTKEQL